jgi:sterol desaturase/sphingolipid hydroxylase (fatty acid hydroxylase superfamily)
LNDFELRKRTFTQQYFANEIMLWMVVVMTLSGVLLAALQLAASYRMASGKGAPAPLSGELTVAKDQLIFKSSVTGLFILIVSFAFFFVFVLYVYQPKEVDLENEGRPARTKMLDAGGLGAPPQEQRPPQKQ